MNNSIKIYKGIVIATALIFTQLITNAQVKNALGVLNIDTKDVLLDNAAITSMVHLEMEKMNKFEILDKYDVAYKVEEEGIDINKSFGKSQQVKVGQLLGADKMITGSVERFGEKIIIIFKLIDVKSARIEKTSVLEFVDQQDKIQLMVRLTLNKLMDVENDQNVVDMLSNFEAPITSTKNTLKLNGPRTGVNFITPGKTANRLQDSKENGGYNMYPVSSMFGYQFEKQYLSSGDFQALAEMVIAVNGLESGQFSPSFTFLNGLRFNKSGWEFGLGPTFRFTKTAKGYYENGEWHLEREVPHGESRNIVERIDRRGRTSISSGLIFAVGKTFTSGHLNVPINLYVNPNKNGTIVGLTFGFNVAKVSSITKQ